MENKVMAIKFIVGKGIQTQIQTKNISTLEAIGLLDMAKDQMMNNLRGNTKNLFKMRK